jgi:hypothetical protein
MGCQVKRKEASNNKPGLLFACSAKNIVTQQIARDDLPF